MNTTSRLRLVALAQESVHSEESLLCACTVIKGPSDCSVDPQAAQVLCIHAPLIQQPSDMAFKLLSSLVALVATIQGAIGMWGKLIIAFNLCC